MSRWEKRAAILFISISFLAAVPFALSRDKIVTPDLTSTYMLGVACSALGVSVTFGVLARCRKIWTRSAMRLRYLNLRALNKPLNVGLKQTR